jgi:trehalose 6-phosphate phosphatase
MGLVDKYSGLLVEDKGETVAVHYRLAPRLGGYLHRLMRRMVREDGEGLSLQAGKRVVEIKPGGYDKGTAILDFMAEPPFRGRRPVFIGDDLTDEPGFAVVNRLDGVSVKVGRGRSIARYRLRNVAAVREWLEALVADETPAEESAGESA